MIIGNFQKNKKYQKITVNLKGVNTEDELFQAFYRQLNFPQYFGFNWDALEECLTQPCFQVKQDIMYVITNSKSFISKYRDKLVEFCNVLVDNGVEDMDLDKHYECVVSIEE